jgi:hypothetical protein
MPTAWIFQRFVWTLNFVGSALVAWKLCSLGLQKTYRFFVAYMALSALRTAVLFPFAPTTWTYYRIWSATEPLFWLCYILVVGELYSLVFRRYQGIYSLGRWFFFVAVGAAVIISALTVLPAMASPLPRIPLLYYYALIQRGIVTALAIFLLMLLGLVAWFLIPLSRNLLLHCVIYSAYFFATNVIALYWGGAKGAAYASNVAKLSVGLACYLCWVLFLSHRGEDRIASLRLGRNPLHEKRLLGQLETLNATLLRTARK